MTGQRRQPAQGAGQETTQAPETTAKSLTSRRQVPLGAQALQHLATRSLDAESEPTSSVVMPADPLDWDDAIPDGFTLDDDPDAPAGFDFGDDDQDPDDEDAPLERVYPVRQLCVFEAGPSKASWMVLGSSRFARQADSGGEAQIWEHRWRILDNLGRGMVELMGTALIAATRWQLAQRLPPVSKIGLTRHLQFRSIDELRPAVDSKTRAELEAIAPMELDGLQGQVMLCPDWYPSDSSAIESPQYVRYSPGHEWEPAGLSFSNELLSRGAISLGQLELPSGLQFIDTLLPNQGDLRKLSRTWRQFLLLPEADDVESRARSVARGESTDTKQRARTRRALTAMWNWRDIILATLEEKECWSTNELRIALAARTQRADPLGDRAYWYTLLCLLGPDAYQTGDQ